MENTACPICSKDYSIFFYGRERNNHDVNFVICKKCGLVYQNPRLTQDDFEDYYKNTFRENNIDEEKLTQYIDSRIEWGNSIYSLVENYILSNKINCFKRRFFGNKKFSVLDIGCGVGGILVPFVRAGFRCKGIDTPSFYTKVGKSKLGIDIDQVFLDDFNTEEKFDIIILNHTLEHFLDPIRQLKKIRMLLKDKGILYIEVPNIEKPYEWASFQYFFMLGHVFYYSPTTLKILLNKSGFKNGFIDASSTPFLRGIFLKKEDFTYSIDPEHYEKINISFKSKLENEISDLKFNNIEECKLHFGPGEHWIKPDRSWVTIDIDSKRADVCVDFNKIERLPFSTKSVKCIYGSHVFEHISIYVIPALFMEIYRVLKPGGIFRLVIPDVKKSIKEYLDGNMDYPLFKKRIDFAKKYWKYEKVSIFEALKGDFISPTGQPDLLGQNGIAHQNAWDYDSMVLELNRAGFCINNIKEMDFKISQCTEFSFEGEYPSEANEEYRSLYIEAIK